MRAHAAGKKVVYYAHSTREDFENSFLGSNSLAPTFGKWIKFCYGLGDVVLTPTEYSRELLLGCGVRGPVYSISNGVDTDFFAPSAAHGADFRRRFGLAPDDRVVVSVGHYIERKGLPEFVDLARRLPNVRFFWFGYTRPELVPKKIRDCVAYAPENVTFPGYVERGELRDAYCGADAFVFMSREETEGIAVLEALACGVPSVLRDIPVYRGWLEDGRDVYKARDGYDFCRCVSGLLSGALPSLSSGGRKVAETRSMAAVGKKLLEIYAAENLLEAARERAGSDPQYSGKVILQ